VLTLLPLWITWLVFDFLFTHLSRFGRPWVHAAAWVLQGPTPSVAETLVHPWFESLLALILTLLGFYRLGWATTQVIGKRLLGWLEVLLDRIPLVKAIYGSVNEKWVVIGGGCLLVFEGDCFHGLLTHAGVARLLQIKTSLAVPS